MCMVGDAEPWTVYSSQERKARKVHRCDECHRDIEPGETYTYWRGLFDGNWSDGKCCAHCIEVTKWLIVACEGYLWNAVAEDLAEHVTGYEAELRSAPLVRLLRWQNTKWRGPGGDLRPVEAVEVVRLRAVDRYNAWVDGMAA